MTFAKRLFQLTAALLLAGCSSGTTQDPMLTGLETLRQSRQPAGELRSSLTADAVASAGQPLILVELKDRGAQSLATPVRSNDGNATWVSPDGVSLALNRGIVVATRGLGDDLMSADISEVEAAVYGNRSRATRIHRYLDGENHEVLRAFICDYSRSSATAQTAIGTYSATRVDEDCAGPDVQILNSYWVGSDGRLRMTRQWIGDGVGYMVVERLTE